MNVIIAYLETMFSAYPQTPRLLEAKTELQGMMEDAYANLIAEGHSENEAVGRVIRDFGNLEEIAPVLGISSDLAPEATITDSRPDFTEPSHPPVTLEEAQGYADGQERIRFRVSTAVMLFILSPAVLIVLVTLPAAAKPGYVPLPGNVGVFLGLLTLFALVAIGVSLLVSTARETSRFSRITDGRFTANPTVSRWAEALAERHEPERIKALRVSIVLWILAPIPLISVSLLRGDRPEGSVLSGLGVVVILVMVAAGVGILLPQAWARSVAETLNQQKPASARADKAERGLVGVIASIYWPLLTVIYLAWSFIGSAWSVSWIIWPIGGALFGAIAAGTNAVEGYRRARK